MRFVSLLDCGDDLPSRCEAQIGAEQSGFEFFERGAGQFGRTGNDALDFVDQLAVSLLQAGFEFVE